MYLYLKHLNSFLIIAGFLLMAGGGAELAISESDPEGARASDPEGGLAYVIAPFILPLPLTGTAPEGSGTGVNPETLNLVEPPEVAAAEVPEELNPSYDGELEKYATGNMLRFIEGSFGALIMVCAGLGAIIAAAFGGYKVAISLLFVAVGAFILRALVSLFFGGGFEATDLNFVG